MMLILNIGKRMDRRYTLIRFESKRYIYGDGKALSISIHPYMWRFKKGYREFRLTIAGINIHYRKNDCTPIPNIPEPRPSQSGKME